MSSYETESETSNTNIRVQYKEFNESSEDVIVLKQADERHAVE